MLCYDILPCKSLLGGKSNGSILANWCPIDLKLSIISLNFKCFPISLRDSDVFARSKEEEPGCWYASIGSTP